MSLQAVLEEKLFETKDRDMFAASEVRDMLLDIWLASQQEGTNERSSVNT